MAQTHLEHPTDYLRVLIVQFNNTRNILANIVTSKHTLRQSQVK